jgi:hypothetical protein
MAGLSNKATRIGLLVALFLCSPASALAECAWVLWSQAFTDSAEIWSVHGAHQQKAQCDWALGTAEYNDKLIERNTGKKSRTYFRCLPDTVDPRGPRSGQR